MVLADTSENQRKGRLRIEDDIPMFNAHTAIILLADVSVGKATFIWHTVDSPISTT